MIIHLPQCEKCQANQIEDNVLLLLEIGYQEDYSHVDESREEFEITFCASHAIVTDDIGLKKEIRNKNMSSNQQQKVNNPNHLINHINYQEVAIRALAFTCGHIKEFRGIYVTQTELQLLIIL